MEAKTKFKQTEIGMIPEDWKVENLANISTYVNRGISPKYSSDGIPVINQKCVRNGTVNFVDIKKHDPNKLFPHDKILQNFDILINSTGIGTLGRSACIKNKIKNPTLADSHLTIVRVDFNKADPLFVSYFLNSIQTFIENLGEGTSGQQELSREQVKNINIPVPRILEQRYISKILGDIDSKIELNQQMKKTLQEIGKVIFKHWFIDFEFPNEEGKPYKSSGGEMVYNEEFGKDIPINWSIKPIDKVADFLNGLPLQKYPPKNNEEYLPVIKIRELRQGITNSSDKASVGIPENYIVNDGDILFSWSGSLEITIWTGGKGALNQHLFKVTSKTFPKWFYYYWTLQYLPSYRHIAEGKATTMGHIQRQHLTDSLVLVPDSRALERMNQILKSIIEKLIQVKMESKCLSNIRDSILPKLISGKIRVPIEVKK